MNEVSLGTNWACFGTAVTGTGTSTTKTIARMSGNRKAYLFGSKDQCEVAIPAMGLQAMGLGSGEYYTSLTASTSNQTCTLNNSASSLCDSIDEMIGSNAWTATCIGIYAGYRDSMYIYCDSSSTNTSATITKYGSTVRIKAGAGYTVPCYCPDTTIRLGFYPMQMYVYT